MAVEHAVTLTCILSRVPMVVEHAVIPTAPVHLQVLHGVHD